jgi:hypothetical protein
MQEPAPSLFSGGESYKLATVAGFVYLKFTRETTPPLFSRVLKSPHLFYFLSFSIPCLLFSFFPRVGVSLSWGLCWFIPAVAVGVPCAAYLLSCWSTSPSQVGSQYLVVWEPSWFLSVMWHGEAMCGLGAQGVVVLLLLGVFSCQVCLQHFSKIFDLRSSCYLLPPSSRHLGSRHIPDCWHSHMAHDIQQDPINL